jgi:hypothetical protein
MLSGCEVRTNVPQAALRKVDWPNSHPFKALKQTDELDRCLRNRLLSGSSIRFIIRSFGCALRRALY